MSFQTIARPRKHGLSISRRTPLGTQHPWGTAPLPKQMQRIELQKSCMEASSSHKHGNFEKFRPKQLIRSSPSLVRNKDGKYQAYMCIYRYMYILRRASASQYGKREHGTGERNAHCGIPVVHRAGLSRIRRVWCFSSDIF